MSQRPFWRWLLRDKEWAWMSQRPLGQYLLLHWARAVLGGLTGLAIVGATVGTVFFSGRRWRRGQAQVHPAGSDT